MSPLYISLVLGLFFVAPAVGAPAARASAPSVTLDGATFTGTTSGAVSKFLGIPFAQPPTGDLRFRLPVSIEYTNGTHQAAAFGPSCPQQAVRLPLPSGLPADAIDFITDSIFQVILPDSEDCLTINIVKPSSIAAGQKLPVVAWIFGGFELGGTSMYDGGIIVQRSIDMGEPVIYVSMNYRLSLFGFLASQEVKDAGVGNLGLQDQREALRWIQKYIGQFGGDPSKVTIWGESAGAISVALQMVTNGGDTEGLFRAGFMESGSPIPVGDISHGQQYYDALVDEVGCSSASDTLACLRTVDYADLHAAMDDSPGIFSYQSLALSWLPRTDGVFLTDTPQRLVAEGSVAKIPVITGDCDDEGTLFSLTNLNVTTDAQLRTYIKSIYIPDATDDEISGLLEVYPADLTQGSPYDTGLLDALSPQFKRLASLQGDVVFQAPRRYFIDQLSGKQDIWVFLNKRLKGLPFLGSAHGTDILNVYGLGSGLGSGAEMKDYLINFAANLDPNHSSLLSWPSWTSGSPTLLTFLDGLIPLELGQDTYRLDAMNYMINLTLKYPI